jgi:tetratricopeptide (TPR) repeat protein
MVSNGLIVWWRPAGARPAVAVTLLPAAALSIRALTTIHLLHFAPLLIAGIAVGGVGAILCFQRDGLAASRLQSSLVAGAFAGLVASGAAALLNTLGDTAPGRSFTVTVEDKHESRGRSTSYYLDLAPWADQPARSVSVPFRLYEAVEVGANVCIDRYPGGLGLAWFDIGLCRTAGLKTRDQYMAAGEALVEAGDYKGGVRQIDQAILLDPGFGFAWELRAIAHARLGDLRDAQADAMKAVALAPNSLVAFRSQGLLAEITVHPRDAITAFGKAIASNPKDSYSLQRRATAELQVGSYEAALKDLDAALALNPGDSVSLEMKASAYRALGRLDDIRKEAASLDSESTAQAVLLTRVQLFAMARDDADALSVLDRAIRLKPTSAAYDARAQLRAGTDLTGARSDAEEALALDPASEPAARILAWLDDRAGRSADALAVIDQAIANHPDAAGLYFSRASLLAKTGKTTDLPAVFAAIRQRVGGNPVLLNDLCWEQAIRGVSLQLALADCDAALRILPDFPAALDSRAYVLLRLGRYREASDAYAAALQRLPKFPSSLFGRSIVEARLGQSEASARDAAAARMLDPKISSSFPPV